MEIEIIDKKENPLLKRTEIKFRIAHDAAGTPDRKQVREAISKKAGAQKERVVVDNMRSTYGKCETLGYAKVYKTKQDAMRVEKMAIKKRHGLIEQKKEKEEGGGEDKKEAEASE